MSSRLTIQSMQAADWESVREIYLEGISTGHATFEGSAPSWEQWNTTHFSFARLVARQGDLIFGWAGFRSVSQRCVYGGVAEVSGYVAAESRGSGVGQTLLQALVKESEQNGIWTLQAGIFPENQSSLALHRRCGFREVGRRERIGKMNGVWRDTILLERRSKTVGID